MENYSLGRTNFSFSIRIVDGILKKPEKKILDPEKGMKKSGIELWAQTGTCNDMPTFDSVTNVLNERVCQWIPWILSEEDKDPNWNILIHDYLKQVKQVLERDAVHQQLLQHVLANSDLEMYNLVAAAAGINSSGSANDPSNGPPSRSRSPSPADSVVTVSSSTTSSTRYKNISKKARRLTFAAPEDLLYASAPEVSPNATLPPLPPPPTICTQPPIEEAQEPSINRPSKYDQL